MTVSSTTSRNEYNGNAATTVFAYTFRILDQDHIAVYVDDVLQTLTTDYTVSGVGDSGGGNITFVVAPPSGTANVIFLRSIPLTQETDYVENDPFPAEAHEDALDKLTMIVQQMQEEIGRSLTFVPTVTINNISVPSPNAGKALLWNATEDALENSTDNFDDIVTNATTQANAAAVSAAAASTSAGNAATSESNAATSANNAATAETNAETAETNAETAEANAEAAASAVGTQFTFDSSTSMADPGTGDFRLNNATVGSVTAIAVSANTSETGNADVSSFIATWADSTNTTVKGHLVIKKSGTPATFAVFTISAVTDNTTWLELTVSHVASNGAWSAADVAYLAYSRTGNKGADGAGSGDFMADGSVPMTGSLTLGGAGTGIVFEGTTADANETTLVAGEPTADRTITLPDATATLAGLEVDQTWTGSQRGAITTLTDATSINMASSNNFKVTPSGADTLSFSNHVAGQSGFILFDNDSNYAITADSTVYCSTTFETTISATGEYLISYFCVDSTHIYCTVTTVLTSGGA